MRLVWGFAIVGLSLGLLTLAAAEPQAQAEKAKPPAKGEKADSAAVKRIVDQLMQFDKNKDGKVEKDNVTDPRLMRLFERADANKDGVVTKEEATAMAVKMMEEGPRGSGFGPPGGPPGGGAQGGPGGPPGRFGSGGFGPPTPGQILAPFLMERLNLTAEQKKQLEELQKEVDSKLNKILTAEQKQQLKDMRKGFGPPGRGPGGPPGGGPPPPPPPPPDR